MSSAASVGSWESSLGRRTTLATAAFVFANLLAIFLELLAVLAYYDRHETTDYLVN